MNPRELDVLTALDRELPMVDAEVVQLTKLIRLLVHGEMLTALERSYRNGLVQFAARCAAPGHASITETDIEFLIRAVHAGIPDGVDPVAIEAMDDRVVRLIEIAANIADGRSPLPGNPAF